MASNDGLIWAILTANILAILYLIYWVARLKRRFRAAFASLDSEQDLATTITSYFAKIGATEKTLKNLHQSYGHLADIGARSVQKIGVVRFNPFRDTGGDQSFVLAMLDSRDSGLVLTSIHGREGTRVYIKPIEYGTSRYPLSKEETAALKTAQTPPQKSP